MGRKVRQKLNSKRGVSLVLALFLLLLCAFAGSAALTSASANTGRYTDHKTYQQQYLSASSAAKLILGSLKESQPITVKFDLSGAPSGLSDPSYDSFSWVIWEDIKAIIQKNFSIVKPKDGSWAGVTVPTVSKPQKREFEVTVDDSSFKKVEGSIEYREIPNGTIDNMTISLKCGEYRLHFEVGIETKLDSKDDSSATVQFSFTTDSTAILPGAGT